MFLIKIYSIPDIFGDTVVENANDVLNTLTDFYEILEGKTRKELYESFDNFVFVM